MFTTEYLMFDALGKLGQAASGLPSD